MQDDNNYNYKNTSRKNQDGQTPCHAAALGGRTPNFPSGIYTTRNPLKATYYCLKGVFSVLSHYLHDSHLQRRILEYLVIYGGDLRAQSLGRETPRDVAVRRRMMEIVRMIEEYCKSITPATLFFVHDGIHYSLLHLMIDYHRMIIL